MEVEFLRSFDKDLLKVDPAPRVKVLKVILELDAASSLEDVRHAKRLTGQKDAYRVSIGDHRLGLFLQGNSVQVARLLHRKEVYRYFP